MIPEPRLIRDMALSNWQLAERIPPMRQTTFLSDVPEFSGVTYSPSLDRGRLQTALARVYRLMSDGRERTLAEIAQVVGCSEAGASARLRDLRKPRFQADYPNAGVSSRRRSGGTWVYRMHMSQPAGPGR